MFVHCSSSCCSDFSPLPFCLVLLLLLLLCSSNFSISKTLTLSVHAVILWYFHNLTNSDVNYRSLSCVCHVIARVDTKNLGLLGDSGGVVNSLDFCPASLKSLGCFYFRCVLRFGPEVRCDLSRRLARKITKRIHSSKPASLNRPIVSS